MKKIILSLLIICTLVTIWPYKVQAAQHEEDMRAVWMATVSNIDFPSVKNNPTAQKQEFINKLDRIQAMGMNTIIVQVRPKADALYVSNINPWSDVLTGTQGLYPGYDPLAFMIEEAHKRGMDIHAWLNPYRITSSGTDLNALSITHPARLHPEWVMTYNNALYYNPEVEGVKQHIEATVKEIVENYDIDGIHFDDYFYPSNYPLPQGEGKDGVVANQRREHINDMVRRVSKVIERTNPDVLFGISPIGIWKNETSDPTGSATAGGESYYTVCADTRTWIQNEWIDYVVPQIYWETTHKVANYNTLVKWWSNEVKGTDVKLYIGQGIYKDSVAKEIVTQLEENKKYPQIQGSIYFSMRDLINNRQGVADTLASYYNGDNNSSNNTGNNNSNSNNGNTSNDTVDVAGKIGFVTADNLNFRSGPGTSYSSLAKLARGTKLTLFALTNGWYEVGLEDGRVGYVSADYVSLESVEGSEEEDNQDQVVIPEGQIGLIIRNKVVNPPVPPLIQNGTTLVPLRVVSENLKASVDWESKTKRITIEQGKDTIVLTIGSNEALVNGETQALLLAPQIINDTTMVPIRFISEQLGAEVNWNSSTRLITIN